MDLFKTILFSVILFSCQDPPLCEHEQDKRVREYFDVVLDKLGDDFPRECAVLKLKDLEGYVIARTFHSGVYFDKHYFEIYTMNGYSHYIELVMLHEVMHVLGYTKEDFHITFQKSYTEEDLNDYYQRAKQLI